MSELLTFDDALDLLEALGCGPRLIGTDHAYARCPNHDDRHPSLTVDVGRDEKLLICCHAGCEFRDVMAVLRGSSPNGYRPDPERIKRVKARPMARFTMSTTYDYIGTDGTQLDKLRGTLTDPANGEVLEAKTFRWMWWNGSIWAVGRGGKQPLLYRHDQIEQAAHTGARLYLVEGEKDADRLIGMGLLATTSPDGADTGWKPAWTEQLHGVNDLVVIADDDKAGRKHADTAVARLHADRPDRAVPVFLPVAGCKDISDHLDAGHTLDELRELVGDGFVLADSIEQQTLEWLWPGWVPDRHVTVCEGDGGIGKSTVWIDLIARTTTGRPMPDDALTRKGAAIYIGNEDDFATVVKGRLLLAGADMRDVIVLDPNRTGDLTFPEDVDKLRHRVEDHGVVLVVIDPWTAFMSPKLSNYNDQEFRRAIGPAQLLAQQLGVAVILMRHLKKGTAPARERGLGTVGMGNAARSVMLFKTDPDDVTGAVIVQHKQNLGDRSRPLRYKITSDDPHDPSRARVEWRGTSAHTVADLIAVADEDDEHRTQTDECAQWLHVLLWENDPHQAERKDVLAKMHDDKFTWSEKVLRSARRRLGVITTRQAKERPGTTWRLPVDAQPPAEGNAKDGSRDQQSGPSHKQPKGTTEGRTVPAQQTPGLQAPAESSQALPIDIGRYRARQATKTCQQDGCNKAGRRYKYGTFCNNHKAEHRDN